MAEEIQFLLVTLDDAKGLALLADQHARAFPHPWTAEDFAALMQTPGTFGALALTSQEEPCGMVLVRSVIDEAEILTIGVDPAFRGRRIAEGLIAEAVLLLRERGVIDLWLEVAETNAPARALYHRLGFSPVGRRAGYYADQGAPVDALVLRTALNTQPH